MVAARAVALLLTITGIAAVSAPVATESGRSAETDREAAVERTVRAAVYAAVRHLNYRRACRYATPRGRQRLLEGFNSSSGPDFPDCPAIIADEVENYPETVRKLRRSLVVEVLRATATRARVRVAEGSGPFDGSGYVTLVKAGGRWRLDNSNLIPYGD